MKRLTDNFIASFVCTTNIVGAFPTSIWLIYGGDDFTHQKAIFLCNCLSTNKPPKNSCFKISVFLPDKGKVVFAFRTGLRVITKGSKFLLVCAQCREVPVTDVTEWVWPRYPKENKIFHKSPGKKFFNTKISSRQTFGPTKFLLSWAAYLLCVDAR